MLGFSFQEIVDIVVLLASVVAVLDYFGIKPKQRVEGVKMTLSRKFKLALMLILVAASFGLSAYSFYRSRHPITIVEKVPVEKIVEKPVERIIEKLVPQKCPKVVSQSSKQGKLEIPPGATISATTNAPDSAAVGVNTGTVTVNPPVNPNLAVITYDCGGLKHIRSASAISAEAGKEMAAFTEMGNVSDSHDYNKLLALCTAQMTSHKEWLTPYLFCSYAEFQLGNTDEAKKALSYYDSNKGDNYDIGVCKDLSGYLHSNLK